MESFTNKVSNKDEYSIIRSNVENENQILTTAIVSTYNSEKFFAGCIDDLISQSLYRQGKLEILVVDSNSEQGENKIALEYEAKNKNIIYLRTVKREPLYAAWNRAIKVSSGKYLTNANTDDRHHPRALEILTEALSQDSQAALAYGDLIVTNSENQIYECCSVSNYIEYPDFDPIYQIHFGQCGPQPLWRKSLHQKYGYFCEGFAICADYEWWLRLARDEKFIHIPKLTGLYLDSPNSIEHREPQRTKFETDTIRNFYAAFSNVKLDHKKYRNNAIQNSYSRSALLRDPEILLTLVCSVDSLESLKFLLDKLYSELKETKVEVIALNNLALNAADEFSKYSDKIRFRCVRINQNPSQEICFALGALHASSPCLGFLSNQSSFNDWKIQTINTKFTREHQKVLIVDPYINPIESVFYDPEVFECLRYSSSLKDFSDLMQALAIKIESSKGF